jgi:predicted acetyltransferase
MTAEIRHVQADEMVPWLKTMRTTYLTDPGAGSEEALALWAKVWDARRIRGAYDEGRCVATLRTFPTTLAVPFEKGSTAHIPTDALTQVTVAATHRRQGLLRSMLTASLQDAKDRGEIVSVLRAAEWPIYGRYGYWPATKVTNFTMLSGRKPRLHAPSSAMTVSQVDPPDLVPHAGEVHDRVRQHQHGHIERTPGYWERELGLDGLKPNGGREPVCVIARNADGVVDGYLIWGGKDGGDWFEEPVEITVRELLAANPDAYRALWGYLFGMDLVKTIEINERPVDEPLEWMLSDGRAAKRGWTADDVWVRLLDVPAALSARRYSATDRLVLDVVDTDAGGWGAGRVTLDGGPDHAECVASPQASPDLQISQRALAALYLSGQTVWSQSFAGLVSEHTPGAADRLQAMLFQARAPWNATPF